ncbi:hypothetical protein D0864_08158 [Hortaea werneckii]|uniref:Uncharacterized protein n=1 Tax=Hortaea werneckii TaxID=91943 RepID=A0A3M7F0F0_HORWE|nr:hypothetical protein D0864_08158 [Hortaea werneckii]
MGNTTETIRETATSFAIVPSLADRSVVKRDKGNCNFTEGRTFTQLGHTRKLTATSGTGISVFGQNVNTGITNNNSAINWFSAADNQYDRFFDMFVGSKEGSSRL